MPRPVLLLLPGLMCDAGIWRGQIAALSPSWDVRTPDFFGLDSLGDMADAALAMSDGPFAVAGHSMGGRVALEVAARVPERVQRLALLSTGLHPAVPGEAAGRQALVDLAHAKGMRAVADAWLPPMMAPQNLTNRALMHALTAMVQRASPQVLQGQTKALLNRPDGVPRLRGAHCPCALIVGAEDAWSPPEQHRAMLPFAARGALTVISGGGHMIPAEQPQAVVDALTAWLTAE